MRQWPGRAQLETALVYARADTEMERRELEKPVPGDSPLEPFLDAGRYTVDDDELLERLVGLKWRFRGYRKSCALYRPVDMGRLSFF